MLFRSIFSFFPLLALSISSARGGGKGCQLTQEKNAAVQELTSEQQRLDQTEIIFSLRKNGGYIHSSLGDR